MIVLDAETRSLKRASLVMRALVGLDVSPNTIERVALEVGNDLDAAEREQWASVLTGEVVTPEVAIIGFDGGRIRTRKPDCGPGVHLDKKGWNETKNAIFVSATSTTSETDPEELPPSCFLDRNHVAKLTEKAQIKEKQGGDDSLPDEHEHEAKSKKGKKKRAAHKPKRLLRTMISSMKNSKQFGHQMKREAARRRFDEALRKAFVADGLTCNWKIHETHFNDYIPILDFTHVVSYLFSASVACLGKTEQAWSLYIGWMTKTWQGGVREVITELREHQLRIGLPEEDAAEEDPPEVLRKVIGYLINCSRMDYPSYRMMGLPTTSAWMESAVKEINYRTKGTEMFWNNPSGAEAILQIRSAALCDDDRLVRLMTHRPGRGTVRPRRLATAAA